MKRITSLTIILLLHFVCVHTLYGGVRSVEEARVIAGQFMAESKKGVSSSELTRRAMASSADAEPMHLVYTQMQYSEYTPALYVFTHSSDGYVIVSADDRTRMILGYSSESSIAEENMPANMRVWMQMYADEIARLDETTPVSSRLCTSVDYYPTIEPLLGQTTWNQSEPYNNHCPIDMTTGERSVTGCMATATAQVMYHHKHPQSGTGSYSYNWRGNTLSVDFSQAEYDWDNMLPTYRNGNYTQIESDAVAQLMYHVGVACHMDYSSVASGAGMGSSMVALMQFFDYDAGIEVLPKDYMDEETMLSKMAEDLQASRPIQIEALTKKYEGHAFVCDGMQSNGYIHINWGWGGYGDGYFALSAMNPTNQGIGGASDDGAFTEGVTAYIGVQPNVGGSSIPLLLAETITMKNKNAIAKTDKIRLSILNLQNGGVSSANGNVALFLYQGDSLCQTIHAGCEWRMGPNHYYPTARDAEGSLAQVENGNYILIVGVSVEGKEKPYPIYVRNHGAKSYALTVTNDSILLKENIQTDYYGTNYEQGQVTDLSAQTGKDNLRVLLQTADFARNKKGQVTSGSALLLDLYPVSVESLVGTYVVDASNTQSVGTSASSFTMSLANVDGESVMDNMITGVISISQIKGGYYVFDYSLKSDKNTYEGKCKIASEAIKVYRQTSTGSVSSYAMTNEEMTSAAVSPIAQWIRTWSDEEISQFPLVVRGVISQIEQIDVVNGTATFAISGGDETIICYENKWLENTNFATGDEMEVGDTVVIRGYGQHKDNTVPTLHGYVYDYHVYQGSTSAVDKIEDESMDIRVQGTHLTIIAPLARDVRVYDFMGRLVVQAPAYSPMELTLPTTGYYIIHCGDIIQKIIIE